MANYNVTKIKLSQAQFSSTASGTLPSSGTMTITPKPGYVVGASDFSFTTSGAASVTSVSAADTGTPFTVGNTVTLTVNISFTMLGADTENSFKINGQARSMTKDGVASQDVNNTSSFGSNQFHIVIDNELDSGLTITSATSSNTGISVTSVGDGAQDITVSGQVQYDIDEVESTDVVADTGSAGGLTLVEVAQFVIEPVPNRVIASIEPEIVGASDTGNAILTSDAATVRRIAYTPDANGEIISAKYAIYSNINHRLPSGIANLSLKGKDVPAVNTTKRILNLRFGPNTASYLGEERRRISVFGDIGAQFDLKVLDVSNGSFLLDINDGEILPGKKSLASAEGVYVKDFEIPSTNTNKDYRIIIKPILPTILDPQFGDFHSGEKPLTISQVANPIFKIAFTKQTSPTAGYDDLAEFIVTGRPNTDSRELEYIKGYESSVTIKRVITTTTGNFGSGGYNAANLTTSNANLFSGGDTYNPNLLSIDAFSGKVTTSSASDDTFTLEIHLTIKRFLTSNLTYQINLPAFLNHGS